MSVPRRLEELLAERATQGLEPPEAGELESLLAASPDVDGEDFDLAAAALDLAMLEELEPMPRSVRRKILDRTRQEASGTRPLAPVADFAEALNRRQPRPAEPPRRRSVASSSAPSTSYPDSAWRLANEAAYPMSEVRHL